MYARDNTAIAGDVQEPTDEQFAAAVDAFRMLADGTRLRLMWRLCAGEHDVTTLVAATGMARPAVSQHLGKLRLAGLVATRRDGRHVHYRVRGRHLRTLIGEALFHADHQVGNHPDHD